MPADTGEPDDDAGPGAAPELRPVLSQTDGAIGPTMLIATSHLGVESHPAWSSSSAVLVRGVAADHPMGGRQGAQSVADPDPDDQPHPPPGGRPGPDLVVNHFYHGIADWIRYDTQGSILAPHFRAFNFTAGRCQRPGHRQRRVGEHRRRVVMAIVGVNQVATFMVFAWMSFLGTILFYRAFTITFPGVPSGHRRYAYLVFFLPSTIFWTADVSKEAIMTISLGLVAFGCAKVLVRAPGGFRIATVGVAVGAVDPAQRAAGHPRRLRRGPDDPPAGDARERRNGLKRVGGLVFMAILLGASIFLTLHYLKLGNQQTGDTVAVPDHPEQPGDRSRVRQLGPRLLLESVAVADRRVHRAVRPAAVQRPRLGRVRRRRREPGASSASSSPRTASSGSCPGPPSPGPT